MPVLLSGFAPAFGNRTSSYCATSQWETLIGNKWFNVVFQVIGKIARYSTILLMKFRIDVPAVLYHRWGNLDLAKKHYEVSLKLDPMAPGTKENYNLLRRKLEQLQKKGSAWCFFSGCPCVLFMTNVTWVFWPCKGFSRYFSKIIPPPAPLTQISNCTLQQILTFQLEGSFYFHSWMAFEVP